MGDTSCITENSGSLNWNQEMAVQFRGTVELKRETVDKMVAGCKMLRRGRLGENDI